MEKTGLKLDINEKDLALVCLSMENEELKKALSEKVITIGKELNRLKAHNQFVTAVAAASIYVSFKTYKKLEKARSIIRQFESGEKPNTDDI